MELESNMTLPKPEATDAANPACPTKLKGDTEPIAMEDSSETDYVHYVLTFLTA